MDPSISAGGGASCDAFLNRHGLARYAPAFAREALFPSDLPSLTREDLRDVLGVRDERDAATFFAAVLGPRSSATDGIGAVRPFVSEDGGAERRGAEKTRDRQTSNDDPRFMSTITTREEARLASLEQHDDEWTRLAMAMSAAARRAESVFRRHERLVSRERERVVGVGSRRLPQSGTFDGSERGTLGDSRNVVA